MIENKFELLLYLAILQPCKEKQNIKKKIVKSIYSLPYEIDD
jgi:hypothetical protein